ncbi:unknown [Coraliomargarita sp. CAG:312]|nr:unknown [Coraliomargarita sp. CAG:312]
MLSHLNIQPSPFSCKYFPSFEKQNATAPFERRLGLSMPQNIWTSPFQSFSLSQRVILTGSLCRSDHVEPKSSLYLKQYHPSISSRTIFLPFRESTLLPLKS